MSDEDIPCSPPTSFSYWLANAVKAVNGFSAETMEALVTATWPGNVRQLFNVVEQSCAFNVDAANPLNACSTSTTDSINRSIKLRQEQNGGLSATTLVNS